MRNESAPVSVLDQSNLHTTPQQDHALGRRHVQRVPGELPAIGEPQNAGDQKAHAIVEETSPHGFLVYSSDQTRPIIEEDFLKKVREHTQPVFERHVSDFMEGVKKGYGELQHQKQQTRELAQDKEQAINRSTLFFANTGDD